MFQNLPDVPAGTIRTMQIIVVALMMGVIMFTGVAMFLAHDKAAGDALLPTLAAGFAAVAIVMSFIVPPAVAKGMVAQILGREGSTENENLPGAVNALAGALNTQIIIGVALLEGAAFFNLVAYIIGAHVWSLVVVAVLLLLMAVRFPTPGQVEGWVTRQFEELQFQ